MLSDYGIDRIIDIPTFGTLAMASNFAVTSPADGVDVHEAAFLIAEKLKERFGDRPFGLIGNQRYSHSYDPAQVAQAAHLFPNLKCFAVVTYGKHLRRMHPFLVRELKDKCEIEHLDTLPTAVAWTKAHMARWDLKAGPV